MSPTRSVVDAADEVRRQLAALGSEDRAAGAKAYLKSDLQFVGTKVPDVRRVVRAVLRDLMRAQTASHDNAFALADELWSQPVHEHRLAAVEVLYAAPELVTTADLPWIEAHLRECHTWALVDPLAGWVVADLVVREQHEALAVVDRWVGDHDFWVRRSSMLALRGALARGREVDRCFAYAQRLLPEREFFIRKVIGWVLRELAAREPQLVSQWLRANMREMNLVTLREPLRKLPDAEELRALYDGSTRRK